MKKLLTLLTLLLCVVVGAWATEETVSLVSYTVSDNIATLTSESGDVTIILSKSDGSAVNGADSKSRGLRWQKGRVVTVQLSSGLKINSVKFTANSNGNGLSSTNTYTITDGTNNLSGSWDTNPLSTKKDNYTWTATAGTNYGKWVAENTSTGDIYIASVTVNYEVASTEEVAPTILTQPAATLNAYVGYEATLSVSATANPDPTYQWYSNTTASNEGGTVVEGATSSSYTFTPAATGTNYYYVVVTNSKGSVTSNVSTVTVGLKYKVSYAAGESGASVSIPLAMAEYVAGTEITLPVNRYFYLEGKSVSKWSDGVNEYALGSKYTVNGDVVFSPVFTDNTEEIGSEATTITWTFKTNEGAPLYAIEGDGATTSVIGTTANGIDLKLDVLLSKNGSDVGKFNNTSDGARAQVNSYSTFTIPAMTGMTVRYTTTNGTLNTTDAVLFGSDNATSIDGKDYVYTYLGTAPTLTISDNVGARYPSGITVSYPVAPTSPIISATPASVDVTVAKGETSANASFTITGKNLVDGTYTLSASKAVDGLSFSPTSFTVADGEVNATITVTYAATESNEGGSLNLTATVGEEELSVPVNYLSKAQGTILGVVSAATTWDWTSWNETVTYSDDAQNLQNVYSDIIDAESLTAPSGFEADKIAFKGQYPVRAKKAQNGTWTIKTAVAGTLKVTFSDTGKSGDSSKRFLNINGKNTKFYTMRDGSSNDQKTVEVYVPAGEIVITGRAENGVDNNAFCLYKIVFTPVADMPTTSVTVGEAGYRTFTSSYPLDFTTPVAGLTAYTAKVSGSSVTFEEVNGLVPAGEGLLLKGNAATYNLTVAATVPAAVDNAFVGVLLETSGVPAGIFVLMNGDQGVGFYKTKNAFTVGANTAYLPASAAPARSFIGFSDDETTGIEGLMSNEKMNGEVYNLQGQRVAAPQKGLYIVNGKKVVMK